MRIMVLGASYFQIPIIKKAKELGAYVGAVDLNPDSPGKEFADEFFVCSLLNKTDILKIVADFKADAITVGASDVPMMTSAYLNKMLGFNGIDEDTAFVATNKNAMITRFKAQDVEHPRYWVVNRETNIDINQFDYPLIVKPVDKSGSKGIYFVNSRDELKCSILSSLECSDKGEVIIEEYMEGPEVSVELLVIDYVPRVLQVTDKLTTGAPHFIEIGHSQPSQLVESDLEKIRTLACKAARAIGIRNGAAHAEIKLTPQGPKMVEIGARMGGDCITTGLLPITTGIDLSKIILNGAMFNDWAADLTIHANKSAAIRFIQAKSGTVKSISNVNELLDYPNVVEISIMCSVGDKFEEVSSNSHRLGYVLCEGQSAEEAISNCEKIISQIHIVVE